MCYLLFTEKRMVIFSTWSSLLDAPNSCGTWGSIPTAIQPGGSVSVGRWRSAAHFLPGLDPYGVLENVQSSGLDREQVLILNLGTRKPHELCQTHEVFDIEARAAPADGDLGSDFFVGGRAKVDGAVRSGDVDEGRQRLLALLPREEVDRFYYITPQQNLSGVQVLEGAFNLRVRHLIGYSPSAGLQGKYVEKGSERHQNTCHLFSTDVSRVS